MSASTPASAQQQQRQKLYRTLHDQIDLALYPQALRTVNKLLARDPDDQLALATRAQLVVALDRYPDALQLESLNPLTRAYCLYKLARPHEAAEALEAVLEDEPADPEQDRARQVLEAQLSYRLGEYERARDLFDELAATAELDSPELADLEANLAACTAQLDFLAAVPATLANLSSSGSGSGSGSRAVPSVDELEARPLALVLPSTSAASASSATVARGQTGKGASSSGGTTATPRARRRPRGKRFATATAEGAESGNLPAAAAPPPPAEDRWIPKRQRPSMRDALLQAKEKQRGRKRDKVMAAATTQGSAAVDEEMVTQRVGQKAGGGGGGGGGKAGSGSNKKKKGGRK
ncbi:hypothetical protein JCM8115_001907 [Rhodotorula mucilaginosa]